jgi:hypothetical protein
MIRAADDRLEGAQAVADELGWPVQRVYNLMSRPKGDARIGVPIWKEPGCGIVSTRTAIADYHRRRAADATGPELQVQDHAA